jgi:DNA-directed RNA polymerase sigma subunit (sigma70/sigma32)
MKISLNMGQTEPPGRTTHLRALEQNILAAQKGDWNAKGNLARTFAALLMSLAEKRTNDRAQINQLIEAGKLGLYAAAKKYRPAIGAERFQIFALEFIEKSMDRVISHNFKSGGVGAWLAGLFGR